MELLRDTKTYIHRDNNTIFSKIQKEKMKRNTVRYRYEKSRKITKKWNGKKINQKRSESDEQMCLFGYLYGCVLDDIYYENFVGHIVTERQSDREWLNVFFFHFRFLQEQWQQRLCASVSLGVLVSVCACPHSCSRFDNVPMKKNNTFCRYYDQVALHNWDGVVE